MLMRLFGSVVLVLVTVVWCDVTNQQIEQLADDLFALDQGENGATAEQVKYNTQGKTYFQKREDLASDPFFAYVDPAVLERPTFKALAALYPYYEMQTGKDDIESADKQAKIDAFIDACMNTGVMRRFIKFCADNSVTRCQTQKDLIATVKALWFAPYSRANGAKDSSGFEHVFMGEIKSGDISGLHSWPRLYYLEKNGLVDYTGYVFNDPEILTIQLVTPNGEWKPGGSLFTRTSPEHDLAILTACYLLRPGSKACQFTLFDCTPVKVTSWDLFQDNIEYIGTAYPASAKKSDTCQPEARPTGLAGATKPTTTAAPTVDTSQDVVLNEGTSVSSDVSAIINSDRYKDYGLQAKMMEKESRMRKVLKCDRPKMIRWVVPNPDQPRLWPTCV